MTVHTRQVGSAALLLELLDQDEVLAWDGFLRDARERGELSAVDIVAGARTVLLDGLADQAGVAAFLAAATPPSSAPSAGGEISIDVTWDGPDLGVVADEWSLTSEQVVAELTAAELRVAFGGFAPGFAYLAGLPAGRTVRRRSSPRTSVPAGAVGLAGEYAGIYPRSSPGGWQLVGHTDAVLFDADRNPPALLSPGAVVRLVTA